MPFRATFDCLWCGRPHETRSGSDLEGWAQLCPDCLGRAGENGFLRVRLRAALEERAAAAPRVAVAAPDEAPSDDWYLGRGEHARPALEAAVWQADLDEVTLWVDRLPWRGRIVELEAGGGWWSPLLAAKGELTIYDRSDDALARARERLLAHRLRAHLHERDPWAEPDGSADGLFAAFWLGRVAAGRRADAATLARRWLVPGGLLALVEDLDRIPAQELERLLRDAAFGDVEAGRTSRYFAYARGTVPPPVLPTGHQNTP